MQPSTQLAVQLAIQRGGRGRRTLAHPSVTWYTRRTVTRKFVYDPRKERVRMVAWSTASHRALHSDPRRSLGWIVVAVAIVASALAFDAAHASAQAENAPASSPER